MESRRSAEWWMGAAFCAALVVAAIVLRTGVDRPAIDQSLLATGRLAFVFFWPAYTGGALVALFGSTFQPLKRRGRELGLAYASVQIVHIGLVVWRCAIGFPPELGSFVFFGVAALCTYLLALASIDRVRKALSSRFWAVVRVVGMNYIAYVFAVDFVNDPLDGDLRRVLNYLPFAVLAIVGPGLRLAALVRRMLAAYASGPAISGKVAALPAQPGRRR